MSSQASILIAGIGNIFLGDDGFGVEVVKRLSERAMPARVSAVNFGIRGIDLAYALMDGYDLAILVDATRRGGAPGTVYVLELDLNSLQEDLGSPDAHGMDPVRVLQLVRTMGGSCNRVILVGCEPGDLGGSGEGRIGLSAEVELGVEEAISAIQDLCAAAPQGRHEHA